MVDVDDHHLGGAARGAARLDRAGGTVADLQEAHQARRAAAAGKLFAFATQMGEVRAGAGSVFEQPRFPHPQIHDAALVDEIVGDGLDEAGVRLRVFVGRLRTGQPAGERIDVEMTLAGAVDAIGPMQAGVEPLRRIGRHALRGQHVGKLVAKGAGVFLGGEVAALPAPVRPGAGKPVEDLPGVALRTVALALGQLRKLGLVGHGTPQEGGDRVFLDLLQPRRHAGLAEVFLRQDVGGDLRELGRHVDVVEPEDDRPVGIPDFGHRLAEPDVRIGRLSLPGETPFYPHVLVVPSASIYSAFPRSPPPAASKTPVRRPAALPALHSPLSLGSGRHPVRCAGLRRDARRACLAPAATP